MVDELLNDEQRLALKPEIKLIEAGPGAGKTRTVVERMRSRSGPSTGVALISFTNAAADEAKRRTSGSDIGHPPNFVGTIDRFLHMFVVTPWHLRTYGTKPRYQDSWDELGNGLQLLRHKSVPGVGLRLSSFVASKDGCMIYPSEAPGADRIYVSQLKKKHISPSDLNEMATKRVKSLTDAGVYDCDSARLRALKILISDERWLIDRLSLRFSEIIVDEFQDCSDVELEIVQQFAALGINMVAVADPDQAIYEFRMASPRAYERFRDSLDPASIAALTLNYRSTPAICSLVSSLRCVGNSPSVAVQDDAEGSIFVLVGSAKFQRERQAQLLTEAGIPLHKSVVLAHKKNDSALLAGTAVDTLLSDHRTFRILRSVAILRTSRSARTRKRELVRLGSTVVELFDWDVSSESLRNADKRELLGLTDPYLGSLVAGLIHRSVEWQEAEDARSGIVEQLQEGLEAFPVPLKRLKVSLQKLQSTHWAWWTETLSNSPDVAFPASHIHGVKGLEFDAVLLGLSAGPRSSSNVLDDWEEKRSTEALRVLYVGSSRAKKLLSIASPPNRADQLRRVLESHGVPSTWKVEGRSHD